VAAPAPLFTSLLNYRHTQLVAGAQRGNDWDGVRLLRGEERTSYPLAVNVNDLGEDFEIVVQSMPGIDAGRIAGYLATALQALVDALAATPALAAASLPVLPDAERRQLLEHFNDTRVDYPTDVFVHQLFERQPPRGPDAVALVLDDEQWTYADLNARANRLAHRLLSLGARARRPHRDLPRAQPRARRRPARDPEGRCGVRAARPRVPARSPGLDAGGQRRPPCC
jgi:non-ribosomal peptide synthetase component F